LLPWKYLPFAAAEAIFNEKMRQQKQGTLFSGFCGTSNYNIGAIPIHALAGHQNSNTDDDKRVNYGCRPQELLIDPRMDNHFQQLSVTDSITIINKIDAQHRPVAFGDVIRTLLWHEKFLMRCLLLERSKIHVRIP